jgi:hypothetical protein
VQSSPLAGFQFYAGSALWDEMKAGDPLVLVREPDNSHDAGAVRVEWRGRKLGYLPRGRTARCPPKWTAAAASRRASPGSTGIAIPGSASWSMCSSSCDDSRGSNPAMLESAAEMKQPPRSLRSLPPTGASVASGGRAPLT